MGVLRTFGDGLKNLVANLGTPRDKAAASFYGIPFLTVEEAVNAYRGSWLPRKIVDIPALDACRRWRNWNAETVEISKLDAEEKRLGVKNKVLEAMIQARLCGGAAVYIGTGDKNSDQPLNPEQIKAGGLKHLNVLTKRVLAAGELETDPESPHYGRPKYYTINSAVGQVRVHPSRLVVFLGNKLPDPELSPGAEQGWGDSVLVAIIEAIKNADSTAANIASLVFEAKVDVISIPGLMQGLTQGSEYEQQILQRLSLAVTAKGINGALLLDAEEKYEQKSSDFANLDALIMVFMQLVSGAADIPVTRLLGQSPGGLNSTGESDLRNYYDRIQSMQELIMSPALETLDECLIRSALGSRPPELFYDWRSLWQTTDKELADIGKITAETIKIIGDTGLLPDEVLSKVAQNMLTESGVAPGLESAMDDFTTSNPQWTPEGGEPSEEELAAATPRPGEPIVDAQPRSLYVRRDVKNVEEITAWAVAQGIPDLADDLHVTIAYSRTPFDWIKAGNAREWAEHGRDTLTIAEGGPRAVEPLGGMKAVLMFASTQLCWRHEEIVRAGASHDYPDYTPHISLTKTYIDLSKVEPYRGRIVLGPEIFEELHED